VAAGGAAVPVSPWAQDYGPTPATATEPPAAASGVLATADAGTAPAPGSGSPEPPRLALLIGNRDYPDGEDLPPIHKNVRDLRAVLQLRGFSVTDGLDLSPQESRATVQRFAATLRQTPPESTVFFYFSGHGAQVDAENLLIGAGVHPKARPDRLVQGSMQLTDDVVGTLPIRPQGLTIVVVDACRTSLKSAVEDPGGLNQVEAPRGCLIAFATGAGRPAIAPADDTRNTFYTGSLVKLLQEASDEITFSDLFRLVKYDVQNVMLNHPLALLRQFAQFPFIAENTQVRRRLAPQQPEAAVPAPPRFATRSEADDWATLDAALWPAEVSRLAAEYLQHHPSSRLAGSAQVAREGAGEAAQILRRNDVRLYRSAFQPPPGTAADRIAELWKAGRGDKDAAARLGRAFDAQGDPTQVSRYEGWMQYASALGNGIAAYELALHYRRTGQVLPASQFEARARELGYTPPPSLDNRRK
jgi:hypothetical protein